MSSAIHQQIIEHNKALNNGRILAIIQLIEADMLSVGAHQTFKEAVMDYAKTIGMDEEYVKELVEYLNI